MNEWAQVAAERFAEVERLKRVANDQAAKLEKCRDFLTSLRSATRVDASDSDGHGLGGVMLASTLVAERMDEWAERLLAELDCPAAEPALMDRNRIKIYGDRVDG